MSTAVTPDEPLAPDFDPIPIVMPLRPRGLFRRGFGSLWSVAEWLIGAATLLVGLAVLASVPVGQFRAGYLLEASGRVAKRPLRDGFIGVDGREVRGGARRIPARLPLCGLSIMAEAA